MSDKVAGYAVTAFGIALLGFAFFSAYSVLTNPSILSRFKEIAADSALAEILTFLIPIALLWLMIVAAGKIVKFGIDLLALGKGGE
jgi:hypothetical protein